jgi:hypothetical protein
MIPLVIIDLGKVIDRVLHDAVVRAGTESATRKRPVSLSGVRARFRLQILRCL